MASTERDTTIILATRGSALALAQTRSVQQRIQADFPSLRFKIEIFKTQGDHLQSQRQEDIPSSLPKGLFTKELETALLEGRADLAVHSLKDLPTELPAGLEIASISQREDPREVLLTRTPLAPFPEGGNPLALLPENAQVGTGSPRRQAFCRHLHDSIQCLPIRGNVPTRIEKLAQSTTLDAIVLAAAGLNRLGYSRNERQQLTGDSAPDSVFAYPVPTSFIIPCVGQGAVAIETRSDDPRTQAICDRFNHTPTQICVEAEREFLAGMGGGCQSPVAAHATVHATEIEMMAGSADDTGLRTQTDRGKLTEGRALAGRLANALKGR